MRRWRPHTSRGLAALLILLGATLSDLQAESRHRTHEGEIGGARFTIAMPAEWSRTLLLIAHGYRPPDAPLTADLNSHYEPYRRLLEDGWAIAVTSYRRNGLIVADAIEDLDSLRAHIAERYGEPKRVLIDGSSMGGVIATLIAETRADTYHGALAKGAALSIQAPGEPFVLSAAPRIPLLFLSNQSEIEPVRAYAKRSAAAPVVPAVWEIKRDGHVNINSREHEAALRALHRFVETGAIERTRDATLPAPPAVSSARFVAGGAEGRIVQISEAFGNLDTDLVEQDLVKLGIEKGSAFRVTRGEKTVTVVLGSTYGDVSRGAWIGFVNSQGFLRLARNFENAARTLGCREGDPLFIQPGAGPSPE